MKQITITVNDKGNLTLSSKGLNPAEIVGILTMMQRAYLVDQITNQTSPAGSGDDKE